MYAIVAKKKDENKLPAVFSTALDLAEVIDLTTGLARAANQKKGKKEIRAYSKKTRKKREKRKRSKPGAVLAGVAVEANGPAGDEVDAPAELEANGPAGGKVDAPAESRHMRNAHGLRLV